MDIEIRLDCSNVDWETVSNILKDVEMGYYEPDLHRKAFNNSYVTVFVYHDNRMIGFGRAISDGAYQSAIYDCAVVPEFQGRGIGKIIIENILSRISNCNVILYASPGKEGFYQKHEFRKMKTGMARFIKSESMRERGFIE